MADAIGETIEIELVFALPHAQFVEKLRVRAGTTLGQAITQSRVVACHPEVAGGMLAVGVWGRHSARTTVLQEYDRIEFYRPLVAAPKQTPRARARQSGK